jgi:hypothetical protein
VSPALADLPVRKVIQALESAGFAYVRTKGSHAVYRDEQGLSFRCMAWSSAVRSHRSCGRRA